MCSWLVNVPFFIFFNLRKMNKPQKKHKIVGNVLAIIFIVFVFQFCSSLLEGTPEAEEEVLLDMAVIASENYVRPLLLSPSTAEFARIKDRSIKLDEETYVVSSYVDSQNGFGAMIRTEWKSEIRFLGGDKYEDSSWRLELLEVAGEQVYP